LNGKLKKREPKEISPSYTAAHQAFVSKRAQIDWSVHESVQQFSISPEDVETGIGFLGENITAALQLGDMAHVSAEIDWLKGLLRAHGTSESQLAYFLQAYSNAVDKNINGQGTPILEWVESEIRRLDSH
jgi:hypothetical protein